MTTTRALAAMLLVCLAFGQALANGKEATVTRQTAIRHFMKEARGPAAGDKVKILSFTPRGDGTALVKSMLEPSRVLLIGIVDIRRASPLRANTWAKGRWRTMDWWMTSEEAAAKDPTRLTQNPYSR